MTDGDVGAELALASGGDAYAVGWDAANGERCKQPGAALATRSGGNGKITRIVPSYLMMEIRRRAAP